LRQLSQNLPDVPDKPHVEHPIGFVQHEHLDLRQVHVALIQVVEETPRRRNHDVDAFSEFCDLRIDAHTAKYRG
jgi:hypothetical protein